jgi:GWxTD domain-containing protein
MIARFRLEGTANALRLAAILVVFTAGSASASHEFPVASTGDIWFQADHAGFLADDGGTVEEYYFRIVNSQLTFEPQPDSTRRGRVFVHLKFRNAEGGEVGEAGREFSFSVPDEATAVSADHAQLLVIREPLDSRARAVELRLEDLNARKRGLLYLVTQKRKSGTALAILRGPPFPGKPFALSDIQFAWEVHPAEAGATFEKNGLDVVPNPQRSYGLLQPRLTAYYEVYDRRNNVEGTRSYMVSHELVDADGRVQQVRPDTVETASGEWVKVVSFDLSRIATGLHSLRAIVFHPATGETATAERSFSVLWKSEFWEMTEQQLLDEARVLFRENEFEKFREMSPGDRASFVEEFWAQVDPSPGQARNQLREEFLKRVLFANQQFFEQERRGMLTDRGRIYIRFGEPDEITRELMPTQDTQLDRRVPGLTQEDASGRTLASNDEVDVRPYEIWTYTRQGTPLFPEREATTTVTGLRFVFVDETGVGHYMLRYSSDFIGY